MNKLIRNLLIAGATATLFAASASAQLMVQGVGSSAQYQEAMYAAWNIAGSGAGHWTCKNAGQINDQRSDSNIVPQVGNLAVVWNSAQTQVWTYLSVDSIVGNRAYFAQPRATLSLVSPAPTCPSNSINGWGSDAASIPSAVLAILNNQAFNAAFTDVTPADALFAQNRVNCGASGTSIPCLGYNSSDPNVGTSILSAFSTSQAQPVQFNIYGTDPISGNAIVPHTVVPVGIAPIILIANRTNTTSGLGQPWVTGCTGFSTAGYCFNDATYQATIQELFTGTNCDGTAFGGYSTSPNFQFAINPILREPMSGTMNTFEFNFMVQNGQGSTQDGYFSQESIFNSPYYVPVTFGPIPVAANNPLNGACPGGNNIAYGPQGKRYRALSTGEVVSGGTGGIASPGGVKNIADSIGYIFFSYANVSALKASGSYGYLTYEEQDPINPAATPAAGAGPAYNSGTGLVYPGNGELPSCTVPCLVTPGSSFPNLRNGAYKQWSLLRVVADTGSAALTAVQALAANEQNELNGTQPDFLPFSATADGDPGFVGYREHFAPGMPGTDPRWTADTPGTPTFNFNATNTPNNGIAVGSVEAGGDVGGCLQYKSVPTSLNCRY
jgi:hypothetical protein